VDSPTVSPQRPCRRRKGSLRKAILSLREACVRAWLAVGVPPLGLCWLGTCPGAPRAALCSMTVFVALGFAGSPPPKWAGIGDEGARGHFLPPPPCGLPSRFILVCPYKSITPQITEQGAGEKEDRPWVHETSNLPGVQKRDRFGVGVASLLGPTFGPLGGFGYSVLCLFPHKAKIAFL